MSTAVPPPDRTNNPPSRADNPPDRADNPPDRADTPSDRADTPSDRADNPPDRADTPSDRTAVQPAADDTTRSRQEVVAREKERFGGMKFGACFFGWLAATGMVVLLTALVAAAGAGLGLATELDAANPDANQAETIGLVGAIVLLAIILLGYFAGGYVAGRMARFNGARQGLGVWLWAVIVAIVVAVLGLVAGTQFNLLANLNTFPRIPVNEGTLTTAGVLTAVAVAIVALAGAVLGGLAGMRFHRRVDKEGLGR